MLIRPIISIVCLSLLLTSCFRNNSGELSSDPRFAAPDTFNYNAKTEPYAEQPKTDCMDPIETLAGNDYYFFINEYRSKFRHNDLRELKRCDAKNFSWSHYKPDAYLPVTKMLAYKIFQDHIYVPDIPVGEALFLYSIQREKGHQGILLAGRVEDWGYNIYYYSYTPGGKLIAKCILYECSGDGGSHHETFGKFINDSTYIRTSIDREPINEDITKLTYDSTVSRIIIHSNGRIEERKELNL